MKLIFTILIILYSLHSFSQKKETLKSIAPTDSILRSTDSSIFSSYLKIKDSLNSNLPKTLNPSIFNQVNKLDDVFLKPKSEFNAVSLGILDKEIKQLSINERRLYTAGDFKPIHLLSLLGGSLSVDPIINAISGRTKRLKRYIQLERKESNLSFLEDHFMDYMVENLNIEEQTIGRFLTYLIENENLQEIIARKDYGELHFLIGDEWFEFQKLQNESSSLINNDAEEE